MHFLRIAFRSVAALAAVAVAVAAPAAAPAQSAATIHVGCGSTENDASAYYAQELGLFKKHGLDVEITRLPRGPEVQAAVVGGSLQIGDTNILSLAVAKQRGINVTVIAPGSTYYAANPVSLLVVAPNSPIRTAAELNGKTVGGISVGGLDQLYIWSWVDKNGGDVNSLKYVELPPPAMLPALAQGRVDAVSLAEPFLSIDRTKYRVLARDVESLGSPDSVITAWFTMTDWGSKHPAEVKAFSAAIGEANAWANANPEKAAEVLNRAMGTQITRIHVQYAQRLQPSLVQPVLDGAAKYKILSAPMKAADLIGS